MFLCTLKLSYAVFTIVVVALVWNHKDFVTSVVLLCQVYTSIRYVIGLVLKRCCLVGVVPVNLIRRHREIAPGSRTLIRLWYDFTDSSSPDFRPGPRLSAALSASWHEV
ncbi:hypothetical protein GY45DRAFT_751103 [Cubamyces sp. BRFM 1775]|nr:hypothetical protein GY45DRAFT_751103 [Cubamyces sp. BRFM 1775]